MLKNISNICKQNIKKMLGKKTFTTSLKKHQIKKLAKLKETKKNKMQKNCQKHLLKTMVKHLKEKFQKLQLKAINLKISLKK